MGTNYKGTRQEVIALNSFIKLIRCAESLTSRLHPILTEAGLTESQFSILDAVNQIGPLSQKELGKKLLKSGGNITMVIDNLERRGFVRREKNVADRRFFTIYLTGEGRSVIEKTFPTVLKAVVEEMKVLTDEEHLLLQHSCKILGKKS
ncbi:MAG: MarR family transcriptional regulator [Ignavibacteriaceae bacterium]|nr:MarR family transcriptional regulator [Ignavibacteriaceae bacterium]